MISKLESAGLGFFVKATETQQKLGVYYSNNYCNGTCKYMLLVHGLMVLLATFCVFIHRQNSTQTVGIQSIGLTSQHETISV